MSRESTLTKKIKKLTLGETINELKKTAQGLTVYKVTHPNVAIVGKMRKIVILIQHLETPELLCEARDKN